MSNERIVEIQRLLNDPSIVPHKAYRRDYFIYELICYINNITACYISGNHKPIPVFSERCRVYFDSNSDYVPNDYQALVEEYLVLLDREI